MEDLGINNKITMFHSSGSIVRKDIKLKEHHEHSGDGYEHYFVSRVELLSISPTTFTNREFV